jgi:two-component SAPR family response regulator
MRFGKFAFLTFILIWLSKLSLLAMTASDTLDYNIGGLKFRSQEVHAKERTSLSLFPDYIKINSSISISFDCEIYNPKCFGYIFRFIEVEDNREKPVFHLIQNPDILHPTAYRLEFCTPTTKSDVYFLIPVERQNRLRITINYIAEEQTVKISCNGIEKSIKGIDLTKTKSNIIFGNYGIENEDVSSMSIRNIRILKNNKTVYFWPLSEFEGTVANDLVSGIESNVRNPVWLRKEHFYWEKLRSFESDAMAGVIYKESNQRFYFINKDSLVIFSLLSGKSEVLKYKNVRPFLKHEHFSIYNKSTDQIISYGFEFLKSPPGKKAYSVLNEETMEWSKVDKTTGHLKNHQHSSFWNNDNEFTIFAGYSDFTYFKDFNTFDFHSNTWHTVKMTGDTIYPRTETAIVKDEKTNILYVFSGFGNEQGKQVYGGRIFKDLYSVDLSKNNVKKLMNLENSELDFLPKGGLVFNKEKTNVYTMMGETSDESHLRLFQISLLNRTVIPVSDTIPLYFGRMETNVYLIKDDLSQFLYCICRECKNTDKSLITIYRIKFPPADLVEPAPASLSHMLDLIILITILLLGGTSFGIYLHTKRRKEFIKDEVKSGTVKDRQVEEKSWLPSRKNENAIWFLGEFKLFNPKGKDITHLLPRKLKEFFLQVFFETINSEGISTNDLSETLWPGMEKVQQKNNRGVTVNGVRKVLEEFQGIKLTNVGGLWKTEVESNCYIDILEVKKMIRNKEYRDNPQMFISLVSNGNILHNLQFEWLDSIKSNYENEILSCLYDLCENFLSRQEFLACLEVSSLIHDKFDPLDETALNFKITALNMMKGLSKSQNEFELFRKRYFAAYNEKYKRTLEDIINLR